MAGQKGKRAHLAHTSDPAANCSNEIWLSSISETWTRGDCMRARKGIGMRDRRVWRGEGTAMLRMHFEFFSLLDMSLKSKTHLLRACPPRDRLLSLFLLWERNWGRCHANLQLSKEMYATARCYTPLLLFSLSGMTKSISKVWYIIGIPISTVPCQATSSELCRLFPVRLSEP